MFPCQEKKIKSCGFISMFSMTKSILLERTKNNNLSITKIEEFFVVVVVLVVIIEVTKIWEETNLGLSIN